MKPIPFEVKPKELTEDMLIDALYDLGCSDDDNYAVFCEKLLKSNKIGIIVELEKKSGWSLGVNFLDKAKTYVDAVHIVEDFNSYDDEEDDEFFDDDDFSYNKPVRKIIGKTI